MSPTFLAAAVGVGALAVLIVTRRRCRKRNSQPPHSTSSMVQSISPRARVLAVLGDPVNVTRTPFVFPAALARARTGIDAVLVPLHVPSEALPTAFAAVRQWPNFDGFVVTKPNKEQAAILCDTLTPEAQAVGAINVARRQPDGRIIGHILDGDQPERPTWTPNPNAHPERPTPHQAPL